jgi:hypothetical protein
MTVYEFSKKDWTVLSNLKGAINFMSLNNRDRRYDLAMKEERELYEQYITKGKRADEIIQ